jgi:hypothetical protein
VSELGSVLNELASEAPVDHASWQDVVARARRAKRRRVALLAAGAAAVLALAVPALGIGGRLTDVFSGEPVSTDQLSSEQMHVLGAMASGVSPRLPASAEESLARVRASDLRRIATRNGSAYYAADRRGGGLCVMVSHPGFCSPDFPSPKQPILDESVFGGSLDAPVIRRLEGFAADGVASVAVLTAGGSEAETPVQDNVYERTEELPKESVRGIVARDAKGMAVYRFCVVRGGCGN